jgi:predicted transcriptional regulator
MKSRIMSVRVDESTRAELDAIAAAQDRDRTYVVNEALAAYLEMHRWQIEHIRQGLREAEAGKFVPEAATQKTIDRLREK